MFCRMDLPKHNLLWCHSELAGAGGLLTMVRKDVVAGGALRHECIWLVRVSRTALVHHGGDIRVWNMHNVGMNAAAVDLAAIRIEADTDWPASDPLHRTSLLLGGFNLPGGNAQLCYEHPSTGDVAPEGGQHRRRWERARST